MKDDNKDNPYLKELEGRLGKENIEMTPEGPQLSQGYIEYLNYKVEQLSESTGILPEHIKELAISALSNDMVIGERPVNFLTKELLARDDTMGKPMTTKGKSNPETGFIHVDQVHESKIKDPVIGAAFSKKVQDSIAAGEAVAIQLTTEEGYPAFSYTKEDGKTGYVYQKEKDGPYLDHKTDDPIPLKEEDVRPTMVLADPVNHKKYVADYDPLIYGNTIVKDDAGEVQFPSFKPLASDHYQQFEATYEAMQDMRFEKLQELHHEIKSMDIDDNHPARPILDDLVTLLESPKRMEFLEYNSELDAETIEKHLIELQKEHLQDREQLGTIYEKLTELQSHKDPALEDIQNLANSAQRLIQDANNPGDIMKSVGVTSQEQEVISSALRTATDGATSHSAETANPVSYIAEIQENVRDGALIFGPDGYIHHLHYPDNPIMGEHALANVMNDYRKDGYAVNANPRWGWEMNEDGSFTVPEKMEERMNYKDIDTAINKLISDPETREQGMEARSIANLHIAIEEHRYREPTLGPGGEQEAGALPGNEKGETTFITSSNVSEAKEMLAKAEATYHEKYGPSPLEQEKTRVQEMIQERTVELSPKREHMANRRKEHESSHGKAEPSSTKVKEAVANIEANREKEEATKSQKPKPEKAVLSQIEKIESNVQKLIQKFEGKDNRETTPPDKQHEETTSKSLSKLDKDAKQTTKDLGKTLRDSGTQEQSKESADQRPLTADPEINKGKEGPKR